MCAWCGAGVPGRERDSLQRETERLPGDTGTV